MTPRLLLAAEASSRAGWCSDTGWRCIRRHAGGSCVAWFARCSPPSRTPAPRCWFSPVPSRCGSAITGSSAAAPLAREGARIDAALVDHVKHLLGLVVGRLGSLAVLEEPTEAKALDELADVA